MYSYEKLDNELIKRYRITGGHCRKYVKQAICLPENVKHRARFVYRNPHQHEIGQVRKRQVTNTFIGKIIQRKWTIDRLFAEAQQYHGLRRTRYRCGQNVSIQALMTAMTQNIKRI